MKRTIGYVILTTLLIGIIVVMSISVGIWWIGPVVFMGACTLTSVIGFAIRLIVSNDSK